MKQPFALIEMGTWLAAASIATATVVWAPMHRRAADRDTRSIAEAALDRIAASELATLHSIGHYVAFGPTAQERQAVLPQLQLDPQAAAFQFDAIVLDNHVLHLRATTTPQGITDGAVTPLTISRDLAAPRGAGDTAMAGAAP